MKRFLLALLLTALCSVAALASDISIASTTVPNWIGPTSSIELRGFLTSTMTVPSGTPLSFTANATTDLLTASGHSLVVGNAVYLTIGSGGVLPTGLSEGVRYYVVSVSGNDLGISLTAGGSAINFSTNGSGTLYMLTSTTSYPASNEQTGVTAWRWSCTVSSSVVGGLTIYTVTIPSITLPATTNAVSGYNARWNFWFYCTSSGARIGKWEGYQNLRIPTSAASTTWDAIKIYNNDTIATADTSTYTKSEIDALLISCCSGGGGGGSAYARVQEEGSDLTQRTTLNFVGAAATAADDSTRTTVTFDADLNALAGLASTGLIARTNTNTYALRSISGRSDQLDVTNGDGVSGNISLKIPDYLQLGKDSTGGILGLQQAASSYVVQFQPSSTAMLGSYAFTLPNALPASSSCLTISSTGVWGYTSCSGGGGGAPTNAQYLTLTTDATLSDERTIAVGAGLAELDGGAGGNYTLSVDTTNAFTPIWAGLHTHKVGSATTSALGLLISKDSRSTDGQTDSDYLAFYGQGRSSSVNYRAEWRMKVDVLANTGESSFVLLNRINSGSLLTPFAVYQGGDMTLAGTITGGSGSVQITDSTGNLRVEAFASGSKSGNSTKLVTATGTLTSGRCAEWDADGNLVQASGACASTAAAAGSTGDYQINSGGSLAAGQLKDLAGGAVSLTNGSGGGTFRAVPDSPATITSNQNNLSVTGRSLNLRLATDAQRTIRGLVFSGNPQVDGEWHLISNVGTQPIDFTNEDSSATSTNRFLTASGRTTTLLGGRAALAFYDNTSGRHRLYPLAVDAPEILHRNIATKNVTNTTTETSLLNATFSTPANYFTVGKTLHLVVSGIISTQVSAPTLRIKLKSGSTVLADSTAITMTALNGSSRSFTAEITLVCTSVGASGAFDGNGQFRYNTASNGLSSLEITNQLATLDTASAQSFDVTATWGTANIQNSISVLSAHVTAY